MIILLDHCGLIPGYVKMQVEKIRVAVLYGGCSAEHEVSIRSAANIIQHLDATLYEVTPIGLDKQGQWLLGDAVFKKSLEQNQVVKSTQPTWFTPEWAAKPVKTQDISDIDAGPNHAIFDVVFPIIHGTFGEDGTLQGLLEAANLPYVGCGTLASSIGMDKDVSKRLAREAGVYVAPYLALKLPQWKTQQQTFISKIEAEINYPVFVKPCNAGSSVGISKAKNRVELIESINEAFHFDTKILIEKALNVLELEIAVLESLVTGQEPIVSVVGEIKPTHEFYSYEAKYLDDNGAELLIPASVNEDIQKNAQDLAKKLFIALECEGMARVDLFYDLDQQKICFNEINTIPGFTKISMYPKLMDASGVEYGQLLSHLIQLAIKRHVTKKQLMRDHEIELAVV